MPPTRLVRTSHWPSFGLLVDWGIFADTTGKLAKLGSELEKRAVMEARKARTGHQRARGLVVLTKSEPTC